jgi:hypothetical protein
MPEDPRDAELESLRAEVEQLRVAVNPRKADAVKSLVSSATRLVRIERDDARAALDRVRALVNLSERPEDYDEAVTEYQAVVGSTWEEAYWHAAMSHVDAALGVVPEHTAHATTEETNHG